MNGYFKLVLLDKDTPGFDGRWYWNGKKWVHSSIDNWKGYIEEAKAKVIEVDPIAKQQFKNYEILITPWEEFSWLFANGERPNGFHKIVCYDLDTPGFDGRWYWNGKKWVHSSIDNWKGYFDEANKLAKEVEATAKQQFKNYIIFLCPWEEFSSTPVE